MGSRHRAFNGHKRPAPGKGPSHERWGKRLRAYDGRGAPPHRQKGPLQKNAGRSRRYWKTHPIERERIVERWFFDLRATNFLKRVTRAKARPE